MELKGGQFKSVKVKLINNKTKLKIKKKSM